MGISSMPSVGDAFLPLAFLPLVLLKDGLSWVLLQVARSRSTFWQEGKAAGPGVRVMPLQLARRWWLEQRGEEEWCCSVCLQGMEEDVSQVVACSHLFHRACLDRWLLVDTSYTCPLCRAILY